MFIINSKDIAKLAGVSRSTVTRVINNYPDISEKTRQKVLDVIEQYNYAPNSQARSLAGIENKEIGLFLYIPVDFTSSPYLGEFIIHAVNAAEQYGFSALVSLITPEQDKKMTNFLATKKIQGAILLGGSDDEPEALKLIKSRFNMIYVDMFDFTRDLISGKGIVNPDNFSGAYKATEYLINKGHKNIMHIKLNRLPGIQRHKGYKAALENYGLNYREENVIEDKVITEGKFEEYFKKYIDKFGLPDGIFAATDIEALSILESLKKMKYSIPKDISIIGFDNIYATRSTNPPLTTIDSSPKNLAENAVKSLIELIEGDSSTIKKTIDIEIVERKSVRKR